MRPRTDRHSSRTQSTHNPWRPHSFRGWGRPASPRVVREERRIASSAEVYVIADVIGDRYRAVVLSAALAGLRFGEVSAPAVMLGDLADHLDRFFTDEAGEPVDRRWGPVPT